VGGSAIRDTSQDALFEEAAELYASALDRLARAYEVDPDARRDLLQEIHLQLWRSFAQYDRRCSLRTWVYRVAHNIATKHVVRQKRLRSGLVSLEEIDALPTDDRGEQAAGRAQALERLDRLIRRLKPLDRQIIVSWLEGMDAASISEITGLQPANVAMKIHRIKQILKRGFDQGGYDAE
jgi:RNA polymerase sigma-70 factor, ECF subfamily